MTGLPSMSLLSYEKVNQTGQEKKMPGPFSWESKDIHQHNRPHGRRRDTGSINTVTVESRPPGGTDAGDVACIHGGIQLGRQKEGIRPFAATQADLEIFI